MCEEKKSTPVPFTPSYTPAQIERALGCPMRAIAGVAGTVSVAYVNR